MSDETKLRACWACGDKLSPRLIRYTRGAHVVCFACRAAGPPAFHGRDGDPSAAERAIAAWNARADDDLVTALVEALEVLHNSAVTLYRNAEGCAVNHYGDDYAIHGLPGYLTDAAADTEAARAAIARAKAARGGGA